MQAATKTWHMAVIVSLLTKRPSSKVSLEFTFMVDLWVLHYVSLSIREPKKGNEVTLYRLDNSLKC